MAKVTRIAFDKRSKACRKLDKLNELPKLDPVEDTAGSYLLWSDGETLFVFVSDGKQWVNQVEYDAESIIDHIYGARQGRRALRDEIKRAECQHDYKGPWRKTVGDYCVKCREPRPKKWEKCYSLRPDCENRWDPSICPYNERHCRRRKGHTGNCSWGGRPASSEKQKVLAFPSDKGSK